MLNEQHINALRSIVGKQNIESGDLKKSHHEGLDTANLDANIIVLPTHVTQLQTILNYCNTNKIGVVPHGGRTGLSGGARSYPGQIILQTTKLNELIDIDFISATALVESGVTLQQLQDTIEPYGFSAGIDLAARGSATIGGMAATNAGGTEAFRHGVMRQRILGLEAVLPNGQLFSDLKQVVKSNEGYDIKQLLIGSEGTLGVISKVILNLVPATTHRSTALISCDNAVSAASVFQTIRQHKSATLLCIEIMWPEYARLTAEELQLTNLVEFAHSPSDVFVVMDIASSKGEHCTDLIVELLSELLDNEQITSALIAQSEREATDFWKLREESFLCDNRYPHGFWYDVSVPLIELDAYTEALFTRIKEINSDLHVFLFGHLGDGNLHLTISTGYPCPELQEQIDTAVYSGLDTMGGSFSAEHGIGEEKRQNLATYGDPVKINIMQSLKKIIDPENIMNPGKLLNVL